MLGGVDPHYSDPEPRSTYPNFNTNCLSFPGPLPADVIAESRAFEHAHKAHNDTTTHAQAQKELRDDLVAEIEGLKQRYEEAAAAAAAAATATGRSGASSRGGGAGAGSGAATAKSAVSGGGGGMSGGARRSPAARERLGGSGGRLC